MYNIFRFPNPRLAVLLKVSNTGHASFPKNSRINIITKTYRENTTHNICPEGTLGDYKSRFALCLFTLLLSRILKSKESPYTINNPARRMSFAILIFTKGSLLPSLIPRHDNRTFPTTLPRQGARENLSYFAECVGSLHRTWHSITPMNEVQLSVPGQVRHTPSHWP